MILLSYNCRGLASPHKKSSIKRMITLLGPQIILLQETMGPRDLVKEVLEHWLPGWAFETVDAAGRSGGLAIGWLTYQIRCENIWGFLVGLGIESYSRDTDRVFSVVNIYGPYQDRLPFWSLWSLSKIYSLFLPSRRLKPEIHDGSFPDSSSGNFRRNQVSGLLHKTKWI